MGDLPSEFHPPFWPGAGNCSCSVAAMTFSKVRPGMESRGKQQGLEEGQEVKQKKSTLRSKQGLAFKIISFYQLNLAKSSIRGSICNTRSLEQSFFVCVILLSDCRTSNLHSSGVKISPCLIPMCVHTQDTLYGVVFLIECAYC